MFDIYLEQHLVTLMSNMGLKGDKTQSILESVRNKEYTIACRKHFDALHDPENNLNLAIHSNKVGTHPNSWYRASRDFRQEKEDIKNGGTTTNPANDNNQKENNKT